METTRDERDRGILIIQAMRLSDFLVLLERKSEEFEDKAALYLEECREDMEKVTDMPPYEIQACTEFHEAYLQKLRETLGELKKISEKSLDENHMVPRQIVELCLAIARKATSVKYTKLEPSLQRVR